MSDRPCPLCGVALAPGAVICGGCHAANRGRLRDVPGLLAELDVTAVGLGSTWRDPSGRGGTPDPGLVMNERAHDAALALRTVLHGWARVWREETPIPPERVRAVELLMTTTAGQAALLASQPLAGREWAADFASHLREAVRAGWRAVDVVQRVLVGTCPCGAEILSDPDAKVATCRECGERWDVIASRAAMLAAAQDVAAPAPVIERTLGPGVVTAAMIRAWKHRGVLAVDHVNAAGQPCYSIAAVTKLAREGAPVRDTPTQSSDPA